MAKIELTNKLNVQGNFFVDTRCIGCEACKQIVPEVFDLENELSFVKSQPDTKDLKEKAYLAVYACPVSSIGVLEDKEGLKEFAKKIPVHIEDDVYFCSFGHRNSFAASSYFIKREKGNILVDSPRFDRRLVNNLENHGGIEYIYLTHKDDVGDFLKYKEYFGAKVIFHEDDFCKRISSADIVLSGDEDFVLDEDIKIIVQKGHTTGHTNLIYKDKFLFSGDNLAFSSFKKGLHAFKRYCWYDWKTQLNSLEKLLSYEFSHVLAGHGENYHGDKTMTKQLLRKYLEEEKAIL